jgi:hypothetical protein
LSQHRGAAFRRTRRLKTQRQHPASRARQKEEIFCGAGRFRSSRGRGLRQAGGPAGLAPARSAARGGALPRGAASATNVPGRTPPRPCSSSGMGFRAGSSLHGVTHELPRISGEAVVCRLRHRGPPACRTPEEAVDAAKAIGGDFCGRGHEPAAAAPGGCPKQQPRDQCDG